MRSREKCHFLPRGEEITPMEHAVSLHSKAQRANWAGLVWEWTKALSSGVLPLSMYRCQFLRSIQDGIVVTLCRQAILSTRLTCLDRHNEPVSCSADSQPIVAEKHVGLLPRCCAAS